MLSSPKKKAAIIQSCYIPWKGYFDIINSVDEFIILDDVQYTKGDWRNRNKIKTHQGLKWLTVPVEGSISKKIYEIECSVKIPWRKIHWSTISQAYSKSRFFREISPHLYNFYYENQDTHLSQVNFQLIQIICDLLGITTQITWSMSYPTSNHRNHRIIELCKSVGAEIYLSGLRAKHYLDQEAFKNAGIEVVFMDYSGYPKYTQLYGLFEHHVSILDLLFNEGKESPKFMKSFC